MARRPKKNDGEVNLDSLMDALTNVVAVMILVLVLVQADVTKKVTDFLEDLEPATPEQIEESKEILAKLEKDKEQTTKLLNEKPPTPQEIEAERRRLTVLEKDKKANEALRADLAELEKLEKTVREKRDAEKAETQAIQDEIALLEATLDETPTLAAIPPTEVTIPSSRPIPDNAEVYHAIIKEDRVHFIDPFSPEKELLSILKKERKGLLKERIRQQGADRYIYDQEKVVAHFAQHNFNNSRQQTITLPSRETSTRLLLQITPDFENGGTLVTELNQPKNLFKSVLQKLSSNRKAVLFFEVHPDGFATYLAARQLADKMRVPAGWQINGAPYYNHLLVDLEVNQLKDPLPPPPSTEKRPPRVGPKLD